MPTAVARVCGCSLRTIRAYTSSAKPARVLREGLPALRWHHAPARKSRGNRRATSAPLHALTRRHPTRSSCPNLFRAPRPNHLPSPDDPREAALPADPKYGSRKDRAQPVFVIHGPVECVLSEAAFALDTDVRKHVFRRAEKL